VARRVKVERPDVLRALIARTILGEHTAVGTVGSVRLYPHQREAAAAIRVSLARFGGALLADAVGLGKTYVALAVAARFDRPLVIAPAVLREQWLSAATLAGVNATFASTESLSRSERVEPGEFVIVDEAHHFRNVATRRYATLARLTATVPTLLLSGTPVHNRGQDLVAQLALFLGARAELLDPAEIACCVIRREHGDAPFVRLPALKRTERIPIPADPSIGRAILELPPPLPLRDGSAAATLVRSGLAHLWASSDAALLTGVRRRLARGLALRDSLLAGRHPSAGELAAWFTDTHTLQLGFPELLAEGVSQTGVDIGALEAHLAALRAVRNAVAASSGSDAARVAALRRLRARHAGERIVAFSAYAETVAALFRALVHDGHAAAVSGGRSGFGGGVIASGTLSTSEVLSTFGAPRCARERIDLLLATDMLSEGLNLQEASVVVHLDLPWTAARLEQRIGRVRRAGATAERVAAYRFVLPREVEVIIGKELVLRRKLRTAEEVVGRSAIAGDARGGVTSVPGAAQNLRRSVARWAASAATDYPPAGLLLVSAVRARRPGCVAVLRSGSRFSIAAWSGDSASAATRDPRQAHEVLAGAGGRAGPITLAAYGGARRAVERLLRTERIRALALDDAPQSPVVAKVMTRLHALVVAAPLHARTATAERVSAVRAALSRPLSAGVERELQTLAGSASDSALLERCETILARLPRAHPAEAPAEVAGILLLVSAPSANETAQARHACRNTRSRPRLS
jgi:hypothetical protein